MKLVADSRGRLTSAELFTPGTAFDASRTGEGILLRKLVPEGRRRVYAKLKRTADGRLIADLPAGAKLVPGAIEDAVRAERDSR
jgi:hypothetical protein